MEKYWVIFAEDDNTCGMRYQNYKEAIEGAERLARLPSHAGKAGKAWIILEAVWRGTPVPLASPLTWKRIEQKAEPEAPPTDRERIKGLGE